MTRLDGILLIVIAAIISCWLLSDHIAAKAERQHQQECDAWEARFEREVNMALATVAPLPPISPPSRVTRTLKPGELKTIADFESLPDPARAAGRRWADGLRRVLPHLTDAEMAAFVLWAHMHLELQEARAADPQDAITVTLDSLAGTALELTAMERLS